MNRLIIIGNGFDLAHSMKTCYEDFLADYFSNCFKKAYADRTFENQLFKASRSGVTDSPFDYRGFRQAFSQGRTYAGCSYTFKSEFLKHLVQSSAENWVDIEHAFFQKLTQLYKGPNIRELTGLNASLEALKIELIAYLKKQNREPDVRSVSFKLMNDILFGTTFHSSDSATAAHRLRDNICILNFNYTDTISKYIKNQERTHLINIHGDLTNDGNPVIFGYGDEHHVEYGNLENTNDARFMINMKSMHYPRTNNYHRLLTFMDYGYLPEIESKAQEFEVLILGHSCGLSDRTLFKTVFEHPKCKKIHACYFGSKEDHFYKTIQIARHFKNKADMRSKLEPVNKYLLIPQFT